MFIYYVYLYRNPNNLVPFYVGYGKNERYLSHLIEAKSHPIPKSGEHKLNTIRKLLREGNDPIIEIVDNNLSKNQACELEEFLIDFIGRSDLGKGPLTNLTKGGDGNRDWTPSLRERASEYRKNKISVKDPLTGETFNIDKDDPRWGTGELVGHNLGSKGITNKNGKLSGYILARDTNTDEIFRVKSNDERWTSGLLVGINKNCPAHENTIKASKARKGIPKTIDHNKKVSESMSKLKWYCNFNTNIVSRFEENLQPDGFVRVSGPHKRIPL